MAGDGLRLLALPLLVFRITGSALSTSVTLVCEVVPFGLFSLVGGSLADRLDRRRLMISADFARFAIMATFALAFWKGVLSLPELYFGLVLVSLCAAVFMGGQSSSIPFLLGKDRATEATAALIAAESTSNMITPVLGGMLLSIFGPLAALLINAGTYLLSQFSLSRITTLGPEHVGGLPSLREIVSDVALGFRTLFKDRGMRAQSFASFSLNIFGFGGYSVLVPFLKRDFHATDQQFGLFLGLSGVGAIVGSLVAGKLANRWPFGRALTVTYLIDALLFIPVVLTKNMWVAGIFWAIASAGANFELTQIIGFRMRVIPEHMVGRVFGAVRVFVLAGIGPGVLAFGYIADRYGAHPAMAIATAGYLAIALVAVASPAIRNETR